MDAGFFVMIYIMGFLFGFARNIDGSFIVPFFRRPTSSSIFLKRCRNVEFRTYSNSDTSEAKQESSHGLEKETPRHEADDGGHVHGQRRGARLREGGAGLPTGAKDLSLLVNLLSQHVVFGGHSVVWP